MLLDRTRLLNFSNDRYKSFSKQVYCLFDAEKLIQFDGFTHHR